MAKDLLANVLSKIMNADRIGKDSCLVGPVSKTITKTLSIIHEHGYIGESEELTTVRGGLLKVHLLGTINKCGVVKPRFSVQWKNFEKFEKRYLPAKGMGILVISTSEGLMTHEQAKEKKIGGALVAYCY